MRLITLETSTAFGVVVVTTVVCAISCLVVDVDVVTEVDFVTEVDVVTDVTRSGGAGGGGADVSSLPTKNLGATLMAGCFGFLYDLRDVQNSACKRIGNVRHPNLECERIEPRPEKMGQLRGVYHR